MRFSHALVALGLLTVAFAVRGQQSTELMLINLADASAITLRGPGSPAELPLGAYITLDAGAHVVAAIVPGRGRVEESLTLEAGRKYTAIFATGLDGSSRWNLMPDHALNLQGLSVQTVHLAPSEQAQNLRLEYECDGTRAAIRQGVNFGDGTTHGEPLFFRSPPAASTLCRVNARAASGQLLAQSVRMPARLGLRMRLVIAEVPTLGIYPIIQSVEAAQELLVNLSAPAGLGVDASSGDSVFITRTGNRLGAFLFGFDAEGLPAWQVAAPDSGEVPFYEVAASEGGIETVPVDSGRIESYDCEVQVQGSSIFASASLPFDVHQVSTAQRVQCSAPGAP